MSKTSDRIFVLRQKADGSFQTFISWDGPPSDAYKEYRAAIPNSVTITQDEYRELVKKAREDVKDHPQLWDLSLETLLFGSCLKPEQR